MSLSHHGRPYNNKSWTSLEISEIGSRTSSLYHNLVTSSCLMQGFSHSLVCGGLAIMRAAGHSTEALKSRSKFACYSHEQCWPALVDYRECLQICCVIQLPAGYQQYQHTHEGVCPPSSCVTACGQMLKFLTHDKYQTSATYLTQPRMRVVWEHSFFIENSEYSPA